MTQKKVEELQSEIVEKEKEIEQLKYKYKLKCDELEREKIDRADEIMLLSQEVESLRHMKSAAISNYDEMNDLAKQLEIIKRVGNLLITFTSFLLLRSRLTAFSNLCLIVSNPILSFIT